MMIKKHVLVTGAASGIGRAIALNLLNRGYAVIAVDSNESGLDTLKALGVITRFCDVTDDESIGQLFYFMDQSGNDIELFIHAAAIMPVAELADMEASAIRRVIDVNFFGAINMVAAMLAKMQRQKFGRIVVIGSSAGYAPVPGIGAYGASKAALNLYMDTLSVEQKERSVSIELVVPPAVNTPMTNIQLTDKMHDLFKRAMSSAKNLSSTQYAESLLVELLDKNRCGHVHRDARFVAVVQGLFPRFWRRMARR